MSTIFYDTSALLNNISILENDNIYISSFTLQELESIKTNPKKSLQIKYKAKKASKIIDEKWNSINIVPYNCMFESYYKEYPYLLDNNDSRIIISAIITKCDEFHTSDLNQRLLAQLCNLNVVYESEVADNYTGFEILNFNNDNELAYFYENKNSYTDILFENEYLIIKKDNQIIDKYKKVDNELTQVQYKSLKSMQFGTIKPKDIFQECAINALQTSKTVALRGPAGSGKSLLAVSYLFQLLEKGKIDKIVIFCNTVAVDGAAKLGFYPGSKDEKLLDSQIGNFLSSKLGDKEKVIEMIEHGELVLLPMADIRGFDTSGMKAGIYITEAQNLDIELMRLCLQRTSDDCLVILDGDDNAQVDSQSYSGSNNGLKRVSKVFRGDKEYSEITLQNIYRSHRADLAQML